MTRIYTQTFGVVGAIIEKDGKILLVKEAKTLDAGKWSHPAGWIDVGEDPIVAAKREVKEETGFDFRPTHLLGIYSLLKESFQEKHGFLPQAIKLIFIGDISNQSEELHEDISEIKWFTPEEIYEMDEEILRDLDIKQMVKDYFDNKKYCLDIIKHTIT